MMNPDERAPESEQSEEEERSYAAWAEECLEEDNNPSEALLCYALALADGEIALADMDAVTKKFKYSSEKSFLKRWAEDCERQSWEDTFLYAEHENLLLISAAELAQHHDDDATAIKMYIKIDWPSLMINSRFWSSEKRALYFRKEDGLEFFKPRQQYYEALLGEEQSDLIYSVTYFDFLPNRIPNMITGGEKENLQRTDYLLAIKVIDKFLQNCPDSEKPKLARTRSFLKTRIAALGKKESTESLTGAPHRELKKPAPTTPQTSTTVTEVTATPAAPSAAKDKAFPVLQDTKTGPPTSSETTVPLTAKNKAEQALGRHNYEMAVMYYLQAIAQDAMTADEMRDAARKVEAGGNTTVAGFFKRYVVSSLVMGPFKSFWSSRLLLDAAHDAYSNLKDYDLATKLFSDVYWEDVLDHVDAPPTRKYSYWSNLTRLSVKDYYIALLRLQNYGGFLQAMEDIVKNTKTKKEPEQQHGLSYLSGGQLVPISSTPPSLSSLIKKFTGKEDAEKNELLTAREAIVELLSQCRADNSVKGIQLKVQLNSLKGLVEERLADVWKRIEKIVNKEIPYQIGAGAEASATAKLYEEAHAASFKMVAD